MALLGGKVRKVISERKEEMSRQESIRKAAGALKAHGFALPGELDRQIAGLENPQYRVAVVGDYQVGKSALINKVFLGDKPLLTEGHGLCTTAVATDVEYGSEPKLEVYEWADVAHERESLVKTVLDPSADDVDDATVSSAMDTRSDLAKKVSCVRVQVPNDALKGYTVIDTPGLDDPEQELLLNTTWRIIPGADVALLVVEGDRQLGDRQLNLLRKEIMGKNGLSRLMVLASYKPRSDKDAAERKEVLDVIKAQLSNIGRDNIPVEMYCFDSSIEDIMSDVSEIRMTIRQFLLENALPGREEKAVNLLCAEIEKSLVEVAAKLTTMGQSEADRAALAARVETEVAKFKEKAERAFERFTDEVMALNDDTMHQVELAVDAVFDNFYMQLEEKETVDAMKKVLERANTTLKSDLQDKVSIISLKLKSEIERLVDRYGKDMEECRKAWNGFISNEFEIKKPIAAKVPTIVFTAIEVALLNLILPFGWIVAIIAKLLLGKSFSPATWLAKKEILREVKNVLEEEKPKVCTQIMQQIDAGIQKTFTDVKAAMEASNRAQVEAIRAALATEPAGADDRAVLESAKADLEAALESL